MKFTERLRARFLGGGVAKELKYPQSAISAFEQGCRLDLRARIATDVLKSPAGEAFVAGLMTEGAAINEAALRATEGTVLPPAAESVARQLAIFALRVAMEFMAECEAQGLVSALPEPADVELDAHTRAHARRSANFNFEHQMQQHRAQQQAQAAMVQPVPGIRMPGQN